MNINEGYNEELKEKCETLNGYMIFVEKVRRYSEVMTVSDAVEKSVDECIREGVLTEFFEKNRAEVLALSILEYDEEDYMEVAREEVREEGIKALVETCQELNASWTSAQEKLMDKYALDFMEAESYVKLYWN